MFLLTVVFDLRMKVTRPFLKQICLSILQKVIELRLV